jgi:KTSC domain
MNRTILIALALSGILVGGNATGQRAPVSAGSVCVKYGPCPLDVSTFTCMDTPKSSFVRRVCYDEPKSFMVIKLNETWYPHCAIDATTVAQLLSAQSAGRFYNRAIRSRPDGTRGPFDCRDHPLPGYP